jgi:hypothetical protein
MPQTTDRRARNDQRLLDAGPPCGCCERRRRAERRLPTIEENLISDAEWEKLFGGHLRASRDTKQFEQAAEVFDRARNSY